MAHRPARSANQPSGPDHDVLAALVVVQIVAGERSQRGPALVDQWHLVGVDQPPRHRREVGSNANEAVLGIVGVDPRRPRRALQQAGHVHEPVLDLGEGGVIPQHQVQPAAGGKVTGPQLGLDRLAAHGPMPTMSATARRSAPSETAITRSCPGRAEGWDHLCRSAASDLPSDPLDALRELARSETELDRLRRAYVRGARAAGATWEQVGEALGMTRQSAWEYFSRDTWAEIERSPPRTTSSARRTLSTWQSKKCRLYVASAAHVDAFLARVVLDANVLVSAAMAARLHARSQRQQRPRQELRRRLRPRLGVAVHVDAPPTAACPTPTEPAARNSADPESPPASARAPTLESRTPDNPPPRPRSRSR